MFNMMTIFRCYSLLLSLSLAASYAHAATMLEDLQQRATLAQLWQHHEWHNLLHYTVVDAASHQYDSQVDDQRFFLSSAGATNPESEMQATLAALYAIAGAANTHAQCRFPARLDWLSAQLDIDRASLPPANCPDYAEWRNIVKAGHVTMVFPAYHLNSPSSMYGHTLLRIDPADPETNSDMSDWLSYAVNFGADIRVDDNSIFYAFNGLSGGYPGLFITTPYFNKIREYNRNENRDIWEYDLNLTPEETLKLVTHLWELKEINFDYYFFDENCSYRLLELLEVARPSVELTDEFKLTAIPVDTVRATQRADMVSNVRYRPSMVTALRYKLDAIPQNARALVETLATHPATVDDAEFKALPGSIQAQVVDAAYQLHRYRFRNTSQDPQAASRNFKLLSALNQHAANLQQVANVPIPTPPDESHLSKRGNIGSGRRLRQNYIELANKMSFHDLEDRLDGYLQGAEINIGAIALRATDETVTLHTLEIVNIFSLTPRTDFFDPLSWRVSFGLERQYTFGKDQLVSQVNGGAGHSYPLWRDSQIYFLGIARLEYNPQFDNMIEPALGVHTGLLAHFANSTAHLELTGDEFRNDEYRVVGRYTHNFVVARNHAIKLTTQREWQRTLEFNDINLAYQFYF